MPRVSELLAFAVSELLALLGATSWHPPPRRLLVELGAACPVELDRGSVRRRD
jgi:hypothetical protein